MPARTVKFTRYCHTRWISKVPGSFEIHLVNIASFGIKDLQASDMTAQLKSNLNVRLVNNEYFS